MIGAIARSQHGIATRAQLEQAGLTVGTTEHRVRTARLVAVHRGIHAVGHTALSDEARVQAALLIGGGAASDWAAAALLGLTPSMPAVIDVTVPADARETVHDRARRRDGARDEALAGMGVEVRRVEPHDATRAPLRLVADLSRQLRT